MCLTDDPLTPGQRQAFNLVQAAVMTFAAAAIPGRALWAVMFGGAS